MKILSLLSIVGLSSAAALTAKAGSCCNVEGNMFLLNIGDRDQIVISKWGKDGTDLIAQLGRDSSVDFEDALFYINKDNNRLIVLNDSNKFQPYNAYTDSPNGGELKFTYYNDTTRYYYWPVFDINSTGNLTVNGSSKAFSVCYSKNSHSTIHIGSTAGKNCTAIDDPIVARLTSQLWN
ncbi:hypothetical protein BGW36DRAFT_428313 [Talaromyces proteolyticus]|uniref:Bulb-type lectin domain-containing protein n=1 Tax=Talaromyces proteolyticus TaxID=1131652 RepID=A0AAD4KMR1_9EURO|nr:uncharacterized protein BGW36DRAFT_428313 [Talaromyces proteolyticus]KAH8696297.1 hypothetical protein BGW36DRAFT_428313 [Talaromyces proteolyticus]